MARDDIPEVRGAPGGPGGRQEASGGVKRHQGATGASRLLPMPK